MRDLIRQEAHCWYLQEIVNVCITVVKPLQKIYLDPFTS